jgi:hypothetical protein
VTLVEALYGFDSGHSKKAIADNRKNAEELKNDKGFVFEVHVYISYVGFLLNLLYGVRYFQIRTASERVYTITPLFKRLLTRCGSKINGMKESSIPISLIQFRFLPLPLS